MNFLPGYWLREKEIRVKKINLKTSQNREIIQLLLISISLNHSAKAPSGCACPTFLSGNNVKISGFKGCKEFWSLSDFEIHLDTALFLGRDGKTFVYHQAIQWKGTPSWYSSMPWCLWADGALFVQLHQWFLHSGTCSGITLPLPHCSWRHPDLKKPHYCHLSARFLLLAPLVRGEGWWGWPGDGVHAALCLACGLDGRKDGYFSARHPAVSTRHPWGGSYPFLGSPNHFLVLD